MKIKAKKRKRSEVETVFSSRPNMGRPKNVFLHRIKKENSKIPVKLKDGTIVPKEVIKGLLHLHKGKERENFKKKFYMEYLKKSRNKPPKLKAKIRAQMIDKLKQEQIKKMPKREQEIYYKKIKKINSNSQSKQLSNNIRPYLNNYSPSQQQKDRYTYIKNCLLTACTQIESDPVLWDYLKKDQVMIQKRIFQILLILIDNNNKSKSYVYNYINKHKNINMQNLNTLKFLRSARIFQYPSALKQITKEQTHQKMVALKNKMNKTKSKQYHPKAEY